MESKTNSKEQEAKKFTYEQLEQIASSLSSQVQQLSGRLQEANMYNAFKRLDYLFKVVETAPTVPSSMFDPDFVIKCANEIEEIMTVQEDKTDSEDKAE